MKKRLPARPNLEQLKNQAKTLLKGLRAADLNIFGRIRESSARWQNSIDPEIAGARFTLADAQRVIANEYGFETWSGLKAHVALQTAGNPTAGDSTAEIVESLRSAAGEGDLARLTALLDAHPEL